MIRFLNALLRCYGRWVGNRQSTFTAGCAGCGSQNAPLTFRLCPGCAADHKAATRAGWADDPGTAAVVLKWFRGSRVSRINARPIR